MRAECDLVIHYFSKIESYFASKHKNSFKLSKTAETSESEGVAQEEEIKIENEETHVEGEKRPSTTELKLNGDPSSPTLSGMKIRFRDFSQPDVSKTGYFIPLSCGHNGQLSMLEKAIYEHHLTQVGFIVDQVDDNL